MNLNLQIISEKALGEYPLSYVNPGEGFLDITGVGFITGGMPFWDNIIYITKWEDLRPLEKLPSILVCLGGGDPAHAYLEACGVRALIMDSGENILEIHTKIQSLFDRFNKVERCILMAILNGSPMVNILDYCSDIFEGPILMFDKALKLMAYSTKYTPLPSDITTQESIEHQCGSKTLMQYERQQGLIPILNTSKSVTYINYSDEFDIYIAPILNDKERIATLRINSSLHRLPEYYIPVIAYLCSLIRPLVINICDSMSKTISRLSKHVFKMLTGATMDQNQVNYLLNQIGWKWDDPYLVLKIKKSRYDLQNGTADYVKIQISKILTSSIFVDLDDYHVVIIKYIYPKDDFYPIIALKKIFEENDYYCGISLQINNFQDIIDQYYLAGIALDTGLRKNPNSHIYYYEEYIIDHIIQSIASQVSIQAVCHNAAIELHKHDVTSNGVMVITMKHYLLQERNMSKAADALHIHKNTLAYRMEKINSIINIDLNEESIRMHMLLSCIILDSKD